MSDIGKGSEISPSSFLEQSEASEGREKFLLTLILHSVNQVERFAYQVMTTLAHKQTIIMKDVHSD